ncbi:MAG: ACP S-malonyltransferase [Saccharofermentanales bacterium]
MNGKRLKTGFVFAGQGSQYQGMGKELSEYSPKAKEVFDTLDMIRPETSRQCFFASKEELSLTMNTQPCVFAVEMAIAAVLDEIGIRPDALAGFSLGEICALTYSGVFSLEEGFDFIIRRSAAMQKAAEAGNGKMAAVLKLDPAVIEGICRRYDRVWAVNYNSPGQTVISGIGESVDEVVKECVKLGGKAIMLSVSGAFHSPLMDNASCTLSEILSHKDRFSMKTPIYSNVTGEIAEEGKMKELIALQVKSPVLWSKTIESMHRDGIGLFIEIGPGKVLTGLIKKIIPDAIVANVEDVNSLNAAISLCDIALR